MRKQEIGLRHRKAREEILHMSVADYASAMDVKDVTVYSWESGRTYVPQEILALLETQHGIAAGWILTGNGSPTVSKLTRSAAIQTVSNQLDELQKAVHLLQREAPQVVAPARRSPSSRPRIPLLSLAVSAGAPTASDDTIEREIDLAEMLLKHPDSSYFIRVVGDSMTDAGISDGDTLIVDCAIPPKSGQVVIAKVYGELTVKRYIELPSGKPILRAENVKYRDIEITAEMDFSIVGVVTSCIKSL